MMVMLGDVDGGDDGDDDGSYGVVTLAGMK